MWRTTEDQKYEVWIGPRSIKSYDEGRYRICPCVSLNGKKSTLGIAFVELGGKKNYKQPPAVRAVVWEDSHFAKKRTWDWIDKTFLGERKKGAEVLLEMAYRAVRKYHLLRHVPQPADRSLQA